MMCDFIKNRTVLRKSRLSCFFIIQEISFSIFPEYQQKFHMKICGEAAFVKILRTFIHE